MVKTDVSCTDAVFEQSCFRSAPERVSGVILTVRGHLFGGLGALLGHPCFRRSREVPPGVPRGTGWQITLGGVARTRNSGSQLPSRTLPGVPKG